MHRWGLGYSISRSSGRELHCYADLYCAVSLRQRQEGSSWENVRVGVLMRHHVVFSPIANASIAKMLCCATSFLKDCNLDQNSNHNRTVPMTDCHCEDLCWKAQCLGMEQDDDKGSLQGRQWKFQMWCGFSEHL